MTCPRCQAPMKVAVEQAPRGRVELDYCPRCSGIWFDAQELAALLNVGNRDAFTARSPILCGAAPSPLSCPRHHHSPLCERQVLAGAAPLRIDQCLGCDGIWLDGKELGQVVAALQHERVRPFLVDPDRPTGAALWLFMLLTGLPVEQWNPRLRRPVAVLGLVVACALTFLWQLHAGLAESVARYGLLPAALRHGGPLAARLPPLFTHLFLHAGPLHLLGNLYFLWVFGDNVEDRLGRARFLLLYLLAGVAAALCHCALTRVPALPVVGASGAISGVMAAYAVLFPRVRLISLVLLWQVRWRATTYLGMWLALQVLGAALHTSGPVLIAWWAHIGGFLTGGLLAWVLRPRGEAEAITAAAGRRAP